MKRTLQVIINASAVSLLALSAVAQDPAKPGKDGTGYTQQPVPSQARADRLNGAVKASDLIGMTVKNPQEETLGKVNDLAVDVESGRVVQVILSTGGFIGIGDTLTAVPPGALRHEAAQKYLHLDADLARLKSAPKFEDSNWAECCDSNHLSAVYGHYGQEPALTFIQHGDAVRDGRPGPMAHGPPKRPFGRMQARPNGARVTTPRGMVPPGLMAHGPPKRPFRRVQTRLTGARVPTPCGMAPIGPMAHRPPKRPFRRMQAGPNHACGPRSRPGSRRPA